MKKFAQALLVGAAMLAAMPAQALTFANLDLGFEPTFNYDGSAGGAASLSFLESTAGIRVNNSLGSAYGLPTGFFDVGITLSATSNGAPDDWAMGNSNASQLFNGTLSFTLSGAQAQQYFGSAAKTNLLTINFTNGWLNATPLGTVAPTFAATDGKQIGTTSFVQGVSFSSDYYSFGGGHPKAFSLSLADADPAVNQSAPGEAFNDFTATGAGTISAGIVSPVPEPEQWGMLLVGFGLVGATMRRRRQMSMVTA